MPNEIAILGGGCFWCTEAVYDRMEGVNSVESGYMGGPSPNPTYEQVCSGRTGHVEVVRLSFDPAVTTFSEVLDVFFDVHDPTTLNRQGNDVGTQYRSVVFYTSPEQEQAARQKIADLETKHKFPKPIVTALEPATEFYVAENYHQEYFARNPNAGYCSFVVAPKVMKFEKSYQAKVKRS